MSAVSLKKKSRAIERKEKMRVGKEGFFLWERNNHNFKQHEGKKKTFKE